MKENEHLKTHLLNKNNELQTVFKNQYYTDWQAVTKRSASINTSAVNLKLSNRFSELPVEEYPINSQPVEETTNFQSPSNSNRRRPEICITEKYINNQYQTNVIPGHCTYASTTKYGQKIYVVGDSHVRGIRKDFLILESLKGRFT